jgi:hypothetical protein
VRIMVIVSRHRRDFRAVYECEYCGFSFEDSGYDDAHFHNSVIPDMKCLKCNKKADETYQPLTPKYPDGMQV